MRRYLLSLILLYVLLGTISSASAATGSFIVEAGEDLVYKIDVISSDRVSINFVTTGDASSEFYFSLTFPNATVLNLGEIDKYYTSFTSETTGICELYFDNTASTQPTFVALNYEVEHYILGIPQMLFALIVIFVLVILVVAGYVVMGKYT